MDYCKEFHGNLIMVKSVKGVERNDDRCVDHIITVEEDNDGAIHLWESK